MAEMGIRVLTYSGQLRDMGDVIEEIGNKWTSLSREQQVSLSQIMAGTRQYNNLLALFDNWENYTDTLLVSQNAMGTLQRQQDIYMESTAAHLEQISAAWEKVFDAFFNNEGINKLLDSITAAINLLGTAVSGAGGGLTVLGGALGTLARAFKGQIGAEISHFAIQLHNLKENSDQISKTLQTVKDLKTLGVEVDFLREEDFNQILEFKQHMLDLHKITSEEEQNQANVLIQQKANILQEKQLLEEKIQNIKNYISVLSQYESEYPEGTFTPINQQEMLDKNGKITTGYPLGDNGQFYYEYNKQDQGTILKDSRLQWGIPYESLANVSSQIEEIRQIVKGNVEGTTQDIMALGDSIEEDLINNIEHLHQLISKRCLIRMVK
jgi:hypothetical protein